MYVIHENELIHVDTGSDVLEHYGVKGMKWGKRIAGMSAASKSPMGRFMGTKRALDYQNNFVKTQNDANINYKKELKKNKYKKADAKSKGLNKQLDKAYKKQEAAYDNLSKNSKLRNYLTKDGRKQRAEAKKEYRKIDNSVASLENKVIKNYSDARKQYKLDKKKLKDDRKNATTGLRY